MATLASNREVRSAYLEFSTVAIAAGANLETLAGGVFTAPAGSPSVILGVKVHSELVNSSGSSNDSDTGTQHEAQVSRSPRRDQASIIDKTGDRTYASTMGSPASHGSNLLIARENHVMFPSGYGIEVDAGENISLHGFADNQGTVSVVHHAWAIIWYVQ